VQLTITIENVIIDYLSAIEIYIGISCLDKQVMRQ